MGQNNIRTLKRTDKFLFMRQKKAVFTQNIIFKCSCSKSCIYSLKRKRYVDPALHRMFMKFDLVYETFQKESEGNIFLIRLKFLFKKK